MCSFLVTNIYGILQYINNINYYMKKRGPDYTSYFLYKDFFFLHNLLHITGEIVYQPFISLDHKIIAIYNGEIYNYKSFGNYRSDGECIIDLYKKCGFSFFKLLDGEFAICLFDFSKNVFGISSDIFATKPLWYSNEGGKIGIASYKSALEKMYFTKYKKLEANTYKIFSLLSYKNIYSGTLFKFNLKQFKTNLDDWCNKFENSIRKRIDNLNYPIFVCLSSGYDSGAICCALNNLKIKYSTYTIIGNEDTDIINERIKLNNVPYIIENIDNKVFNKNKIYMKQKVEDFNYSNGNSIKNDKASVGLTHIFSKAKLARKRIYISGQGADEIISDYGFKKHKLCKHSCFGGYFPKKLDTIFPENISTDKDGKSPVWLSFYEGTQKDYLNKEENISGIFGIEGRYPFLDKYLVQEFLSISSKLKNENYKSVVYYYLKKNNYPVAKEKKIGFSVIKD